MIVMIIILMTMTIYCDILWYIIVECWTILLNSDCDNDDDANDDVNDDDDANVDVNDEEEEEATQALSRQVASLKKSQNLKSISSSGSRVINWDCHQLRFNLLEAKTENYQIIWWEQNLKLSY